ncbi:HalOD1 output domain-containing protein [Haladaptatus sp.]|uniref:HalOD1 output domain-containing protein n=1 Tax=Haladaptatus sp. TaxID=1973141 RepID=UPI003C660327
MSVTATSKTLDGHRSNQASAVALEALLQYDGIDLDKADLRLYDIVDPEALDSLFSHHQGFAPSIEFEVCDATVRIWQSDNEIYAQVSDPSE